MDIKNVLKNNDFYNGNPVKVSLVVTLISTASILNGIGLSGIIFIISKIIHQTIESSTYLYAYIAGSVGFLLSAPVNLFKIVKTNNHCSTFTIIKRWIIFIIVVFFMGIFLGLCFVVLSITKSKALTIENIAIQLISGMTVLYLGTGIHWLVNGCKRPLRR